MNPDLPVDTAADTDVFADAMLVDPTVVLSTAFVAAAQMVDQAVALATAVVGWAADAHKNTYLHSSSCLPRNTDRQTLGACKLLACCGFP